MKLPLSLLGLFFLTGNCAYATPTVIGNTIHWPDEGWYQVQSVNVSGIHEVCAGGTSCNVTAGEYIVINHTTGERFIEIMVASLTHPVEPESPIVVSGNTISWPDNGWYQVQNEIDFSESCSGVRSCEVVPGSYVVINHSTGIRYSGIEVESEGGDEIEPPTPLVVEVDEFTISWSDNGWYQAQNASGSSTICEGTRSCDVPPGEYIVINHTTGQRVEGVIVSEPSSQIEDNESPVIGELADSYTIKAGEIFTLNVTATDPNGSVPSFDSTTFYTYDALLFEDNNDGSASFTWDTSVLDIGEHDVFLDAYDSDVIDLHVSTQFTINIIANCEDILNNSLVSLDCLSAENGISVSPGVSNPLADMRAIRSAGDFNGDGFLDILIPLAYDGSNQNTDAIIVLGSAEGWTSNIVINELSDDRKVSFINGY